MCNLIEIQLTNCTYKVNCTTIVVHYCNEIIILIVATHNDKMIFEKYS